jgi:hypothetical protein
MKYGISHAKKLKLPDAFEHSLELTLSGLNTTLRKKIKLAEAIKELSKLYTTTDGEKSDIWDRADYKAGYLAYFLPLNYIRLSVLASEARSLGFLDDVKTIVDVGSGPGTAELAFYDHDLLNDREFLNFEASDRAVELHEAFFQNHRVRKPKRLFSLEDTPQKSLGIFSYSLNEMNDFTQFSKFDSLMILEPSTHQEARKLMKLRQELMDNGYHIWAPCTHKGECPLLKHSKKDWCHFRVFWERPLWMQQLEQPLGFNNRTLTYSYLLAKKTPNVTAVDNNKIARIVGDTLDEKGKTKQAMCRSDEREFVSWLHRHKDIENIPRGSVIELPENAEVKGSEVRITENVKRLWEP